MTIRPSLRALLVPLAAVLLGGLAVPPAVADTQDEPVTWTIEPSGAEAGDSRISLRHAVDPGETVSDHVVVTNFGPGEATFRVYAGDGVVGGDGSFDLLPTGEPPVDGGSWIAIGPDGAEEVELTLAAEESQILPIRIAVPEDATPGDHPAGVVAELVTDSDALLTTRVGVRVHLRVTGEVEPAVVAHVLGTSWQPSWNPFQPGTLRLDLAIENAGNVRVGADTDVAVSGPFGLAAAGETLAHREVLPGQQVTAQVEMPLWGLVLTSGEVVATPVAVGEDETLPEAAPGRTAVSVVTIPWSQLALVVLLVLGLVAWRRRRRSAEARIQARVDAAVAAATAAAAQQAD